MSIYSAAESVVAPAPNTRPLAVQSAWALELGLLLGLGVLALVIRLPNYQLIPAFTDEVEDMYKGLLITQGRLVPLVDEVSTYNGSLWSWLLAAGFWFSGNSLYAPRMLALGFGVLGVLATYPLGRAWGGRLGGLLAVTLMSTASVHIVVNSHVAWGNCITPLFTTLGIWSLYEACRPDSSAPRPLDGRSAHTPFGARQGGGVVRSSYLLLSGLFWGLAFQTHPSVLALVVGSAIFVVWQARRLLRSRWLYAAGGLFLLVNANILLYNLATGFDSLYTAVDRSAYHARNEGMNLSVYGGRLTWLLMGLFQNLAGAVDLRDGNVDYLVEPALWPISLVALASVIWIWRRGNRLPGLLLLSTVLVFPLFNAFFEPILNGRYLEPIIPVLFAVVSALFAQAFSHLRAVRSERCSHRLRPAWLGEAGLGLAALFLVLHPVLSLQAYYQQETKVGRTNSRYLQVVEMIKSSRRSEDTVFLDRAFQDVVLGKGVGRAVRFFRVALELSNLSVRVANLGSAELLDPGARCRDQFVILASRRTDVNDDIIANLNLRDLEGQPAKPPSQASAFAVYRLGSLPNAAASC